MKVLLNYTVLQWKVMNSEHDVLQTTKQSVYFSLESQYGKTELFDKMDVINAATWTKTAQCPQYTVEDDFWQWLRAALCSIFVKDLVATKSHCSEPVLKLSGAFQGCGSGVTWQVQTYNVGLEMDYPVGLGTDAMVRESRGKQLYFCLCIQSKPRVFVIHLS